MEEIIYITNIIVVMVSEFHLTSTCVPVGHCRIIVPSFIEDDLPPEAEYLTPEEQGTQDVRVTNWAILKRVAVWLRLETIANYGEDINRSLHEEDHTIADLCRLLMDVGTCPFEEEDVLARIVAENIEDAKERYSIAERNREAALQTHQSLVEKIRNAEVEYTNIPVGHGSRQSKADDLVRLKSQAERALSTIEEHRDTMSSLHQRLHLVGEMDTPPPTPQAQDDEDGDPEEESQHSEQEGMEVDEEEGDTEEEEDDDPPAGGVPPPPNQDQDSAGGTALNAPLPQGTELPTEEDDILLDGDEETPATTRDEDPPAEFSGELEGTANDPPPAHR